MSEHCYWIDPQAVIDTVSKLNFPRVIGTDGERRGFQVIKETLDGFGVRAWFEEFRTPWIEIANAELETGGGKIPITPLISPLFDGPWMPIQREVDEEGILVDAVDPALAEKQILVRTLLNISTPCAAGASAQLFACTPQEGFVAYYLADVSRAGEPAPSAYVDPDTLDSLNEGLGSRCRIRWSSATSEKTLRNLVAEVRGTKRPDEVIAVGAHTDSFPGTVGADDNASGCARLVEFARWFMAHPPARTMRFIWFTGEELDRRGSREYVAAHCNDPERICLFVNVDGGVCRDYKRFPVNVENADAVDDVVRTRLGSIVDTKGSGAFVATGDCLSASDAGSFCDAGIPALFAPGTGKRKKTGPYPHLPTDTPDQLDPDCVLTASVVGLAFIDAAQKHGVSPPIQS
jgi:aminopeptidase YwaD